MSIEALSKSLLAEIERSHRDPESSDYNACDTDPCDWCRQARTIISHIIESELGPKEWLLSGGGGFEDGEDGIRAANFTGEGLLDMLQAYRDYLVDK